MTFIRQHIPLGIFLMILLIAHSNSSAQLHGGSARGNALNFPAVIPADDSMLDSAITSSYWNHAAALAWTWMHDTRSADTALVILPDTLVSTFYNALVHVHKAWGTEGHDSAIAARIHAPLWPDFYWTGEITIDLKKAPWANAWAAETQLTGNAAADSLVRAYGLTPSVVTKGKNSIKLVFGTEVAAQTDAITLQLVQLNGLRPEVPIPAIVPDGGSITARADDTSWLLTYRAGSDNGFGDSRLGGRTWSFRVHPNGNVEFAGAGYAPMPGH